VKYTPQQYADAVIRQVYKVENIYNLGTAIGYTATKMSIWASKKAEIAVWATDGTEEHAARNHAEWEIADTKFKAYLIAFNTLSAKLPEMVMEVEL
jgi:predicted O-methyltransferase YrrM